jgi:YVTN family beta-propeller protein
MGALVASPSQAGASTAPTISVGARPVGAAVDPATDTIYVANSSSNTVSVIDGSTEAVTATISVGTHPSGVAVDPATDTVYVTDTTSNKVSVIDGSTDTVTSTISVSAQPSGVAVDPATDTVYVANFTANNFSVIDGSTNAVTSTVSVGSSGPTGVAVDPATDTVYITNYNSDTVSVIDGSTNAETATISGESLPNGVAVDPTTDTVYVANNLGHKVSVIDGSTNAVTATISVGTVPVGVAVDPATDTVYVTNRTADSVSVIDGSTDAVTATISVGTYPSGVAVDPTTDTVYVANGGSTIVSYIADGGTAPSGTAPTISAPETSATATTGQAMTPVTFSATGTPTPTITETGALPAGVSLSSSGVLSGTPTQSGTYSITVTASNGVSPNATASFTLHVTAPPTITTPAPTISAPTSATFDVGTASSFQIGSASYPTPTLSLSPTSTLPKGLRFSAGSAGTATISGTPAAGTGGSYLVVVDASSSAGAATQAIHVVVDAKATFISSQTIDLDAGTSVSYRVTSTDGYPVPSLTVTGLPAGLSFGAQANGTASISGTLQTTAKGTYHLVFTATSSLGTVTQDATLLVQAPGTRVLDCPTGDTCSSDRTPPTIKPSTTFIEGVAASYRIVATGTPTPACSESGALPAGVSLSSSCVLSGTPTVAGVFRFTVTVSNGVAPNAVQPFVLIVKAHKVVVVHPSGPDYRFTGVLYGALHYRVVSHVSFKGVRVAVRVAARGKTLETLRSNFGFSVGARLGRVHVVIQRDVRTVKAPETVHGQRRLVAERTFFYGGVLVLVEPAHHGALVFHSFADVSLTGKRVHAVAIGDLVTSVRVRVRVKVHGQERLVWRVRKVAHPLRLAIEMAPSVS